MNWDLAIDRNRTALLRIVGMLVAVAGLVEGGCVAVLPRRVRNAVLAILRPAESATRRLIVIAAERSAPADAEPVPQPGPGTESRKRILRTGDKTRSRPANRAAPASVGNLPLLDPLKTTSVALPKRRAGVFPRITAIGVFDPCPVPAFGLSSPDDPVGAARLGRRLAALKRALDDLDAQVRRLVRWRARRNRRLKPGRLCPMRPGHPPGFRRRPCHEADGVLHECHALAHYALSLSGTPERWRRPLT